MADSGQGEFRFDLLLKAAEAGAVDLRRIRRYQFFTFLLALLTAIYCTRDLLLPICEQAWKKGSESISMHIFRFLA